MAVLPTPLSHPAAPPETSRLRWAAGYSLDMGWREGERERERKKERERERERERKGEEWRGKGGAEIECVIERDRF